MSGFNTVIAKLTRNSDLLLAGLIVFIISLMILPLPTFLVDLLLATNLGLAVTLLMMSLYINNILAFSTFPSMLLFTTLLRLSLNITTTRLILIEADAGEVIETFGEFVVGGNLVVGAVIFAEILPPGTIPETAAAGAAIGLKLIHENGASVTGQLSADAAALQRLADCVSALPAQSGDVTRYPLVAAVEVGRTSLTVSQLAAIETHDVVVIQELVDTEPSAALLRFPAPLPAWQTRIEDGGLRLLRTLRVADIPAGGQLQVSFRRGAFTMTAGEIAGLQPDTLLPAHLSDQTVMWLQGTAIAVGEMVAFRGHTGLRITRLLNRDAAVAASTIAPLELGDHEEQTVDDFAPATDAQRAPDSDDVEGQNSIADTEDIV